MAGRYYPTALHPPRATTHSGRNDTCCGAIPGRLQLTTTLIPQLQPQTGAPAALAAIGTVHWDGECLHEQDLLVGYAEEWLWQPSPTSVSSAWATPDTRGLRVVVGETTDREFRICHSSHPWREGRKLAELDGTGSICNRP